MDRTRGLVVVAVVVDTFGIVASFAVAYDDDGGGDAGPTWWAVVAVVGADYK